MRSALLELSAKVRSRIIHEVPAGQVTTFGVGRGLETLCEPNSFEELESLVRFCEAEGLKWRMLGAGSNVALPDVWFPEIVIRLGKGFAGWVEHHGEVSELPSFKQLSGIPEASASESLFLFGASTACMPLCRILSERGHFGLQFTAGIPASIGGAIAMNAGAHGGEIKDSLVGLYLLEHNTLVYRSRESLHCGYRTMNLPANAIVLAGVFRLMREQPEVCREERRRCLSYRKKTQPLHLPSAGSVFRNPAPQHAAGALLEHVGFKGRRLGAVAFSDMHANWLVRLEKEGRCSDAQELVRDARAAVEKDSGIVLETELLFW